MSCGSSWYWLRGGVVLQGDDLGDLAAGELDEAGFLVEVRIGPGEDFDGVGVDLVVAHGVAARFGVAAAAQFGGDIGGREMGRPRPPIPGAAKILAVLAKGPARSFSSMICEYL